MALYRPYADAQQIPVNRQHTAEMALLAHPHERGQQCLRKVCILSEMNICPWRQSIADTTSLAVHSRKPTGDDTAPSTTHAKFSDYAAGLKTKA